MTDPFVFPTYLTLVCGSRSLADRPFGEAWARHEIDCALECANGVVSGDAVGVDALVRLWALEHPAIPAAFWHTDGTIQSAPGRVLGRWCAADRVPAEGDPAWRRWPLVRNDVMARALARRAARDGREAVAYGLIDPDSPTEGTAHTLGCCRRYGVPTHWRRFAGEATMAQGSGR